MSVYNFANVFISMHPALKKIQIAFHWHTNILKIENSQTKSFQYYINFAIWTFHTQIPKIEENNLKKRGKFSFDNKVNNMYS